MHDSIVYLERLDRQRQRFDFHVGAVGLDAGYATSGIAKGLEERQILGVTGYRNPTPPKDGMMRKSQFVFEPETDGYRCPQGQLLTYATTDRNGYKHYRSDPSLCRDCPLLASCTANAKAERTITRHVWADARERTDANRKTARGKAIYKRRKETVAPLPMPNSSTGIAMPASAASSKSNGNAFWRRAPRTSRRSQWQSPKPRTPPGHKGTGPIEFTKIYGRNTT